VIHFITKKYLTLKPIKRVQISITDDDETGRTTNQKIIFEMSRPVKRAIEFLKEFGVNVTQQTLYHLWRLPQFDSRRISFGIPEEYHEKLLNICPLKMKIPLNDALDKESAHFSILPLTD